MKDAPLFTQQEARTVRKSVAIIGTKALQLLKQELEQERRGSMSEAWAKKFKIVADQIRRDFRLDGEGAAAAGEEEAPAEPRDPLADLRLVAEDEEAA